MRVESSPHQSCGSFLPLSKQPSTQPLPQAQRPTIQPTVLGQPAGQKRVQDLSRFVFYYFIYLNPEVPSFYPGEVHLVFYASCGCSRHSLLTKHTRCPHSEPNIQERITGRPTNGHGFCLFHFVALLCLRIRFTYHFISVRIHTFLLPCALPCSPRLVRRKISRDSHLLCFSDRALPYPIYPHIRPLIQRKRLSQASTNRNNGRR